MFQVGERLLVKHENHTCLAQVFCVGHNQLFIRSMNDQKSVLNYVNGKWMTIFNKEVTLTKFKPKYVEPQLLDYVNVKGKIYIVTNYTDQLLECCSVDNGLCVIVMKQYTIPNFVRCNLEENVLNDYDLDFICNPINAEHIKDEIQVQIDTICRIISLKAGNSLYVTEANLATLEIVEAMYKAITEHIQKHNSLPKLGFWDYYAQINLSR